MITSIGVIGGGQLGRMFALDAKRMGYHVVTLDPQEHSPCGQVADEQLVARYDDLEAIDRLGKMTDIVTYEFENIAIESVRYLETHGYHVTPSSDVLRITQDRLLEKRFVRECGAMTADFDEINDAADVERAAKTIGFPAVIKTTRGGYDGKGQWRVQSIEDARAALHEAKGAPLIWEAFVPFKCEISVVATRDAIGNVMAYPPGENTHEAGILSTTVAPARLSRDVIKRAFDVVFKIAEGLRIVGTFCVEFFVTEDDEVLVNEIAPRPHNSGHYTIDVTSCSQYEQHVRAICALPLASPRIFSHAIMKNILGTGTGDRLFGVEKLLADSAIVLHMYGKKHAVKGRKMGHFTMLVDGPVEEDDIARANAAHALLHWG